MAPKNTKHSKNSRKRSDKTKRCAVKGCPSKVGGEKRFFSFPKDKVNGGFAPVSKLWSIFTRIKDFQPMRTQVLCELHFSSDWIHQGKNCVKARAVPTIYYRDGEQVTVLYDIKKCEYYGKEAEKMFQEIQGTQDKSHTKSKRKDKLKDIKTLCRFCFTNRLCAPLDNFKSYSTEFDEMQKFLGINVKCELFQEIICSPCFEKTIELTQYRKRCQDAHKNLMKQIDELDLNTDSIPKEPEPTFLGFKQEPVDIDYDPLDTDAEAESTHMNDNDDHYGGGFDSDRSFDNDETFVSVTPYEVSIKVEKTSDDLDDEDDEIPLSKRFKESEPSTSKKKEGKADKEPKITVKQEDPDSSQEKISEAETEVEETPVKKAKKTEKLPAKKPEKTPAKKKSYECFFCRVKIVGLKTYDDHKCETKKVKCEVNGCENFFVTQAGYNQHIFHKHGLPKIGKKYCPACRTTYQMNAIMFDRHCRQCTKENDYVEKQIKCSSCSMVCDNIRIYAAHRMIHETKNLKKSIINEKGVKVVPKKQKTRNAICDLCGKNFDGPGLQMHKKNVHLVDFTGQMFHCDQCPIAKPTKRLLQNHVRRTHVIQSHPCQICGKVFKSRDSWRMHQLVHNKHIKEENRCEYCPSSSGFLTKAELKKHMAVNHGGEQPVRNFVCNICNAAYSRDDQLIRHKSSVHRIHENQYTADIISQYIKD